MNKLHVCLSCFSIAALILLILLLPGCSSGIPVNASELPPEQYRYGGVYRVHFVENAPQICAERFGLYSVVACATRDEAWMPEPCLRGRGFNPMMCHEKGHMNGWRH